MKRGVNVWEVSKCGMMSAKRGVKSCRDHSLIAKLELRFSRVRQLHVSTPTVDALRTAQLSRPRFQLLPGTTPV